MIIIKKYAQENGLKFDIRSEKESAELFKDDDSVNFEAEANKLHGQQQAPDNTVTTQNNNQQQAVQNNATQAQELPATGEATDNGLVASIATALLAVGSLLTFKRFSKEK
ncbi:LPXTG cell wall anchor domain-containing protein [Staphylococcus warneri]